MSAHVLLRQPVVLVAGQAGIFHPGHRLMPFKISCHPQGVVADPLDAQ
jgi:hypothetical protein